ncbi:DUF4007 family protein [Streptomyces sp. DSM 44917]|uniref:DUF4007 family protein n=1 Tax=Streptomyces boetiae TaxID=3075541 RepID=A0ABU2L702_9ACTN|nr:DUF4007 family protein [Streptomyces sp. DSM 44917]MDT0307226.1 DUF4007 family protein [Streptomyces sp. DSM 44917]
MPEPPLSGCVPAFGRHGSYPIRLGWLAKVYSALREDPLAFSRPQAPVVLGVGASMVRAMRFWSRAAGLIRDGKRTAAGRPAILTRRGTWLLDDEHGADPYLDDPATLWLLHWWLLSARPCHLPTARFLFGHWWKSRFTRADLRAAVQRAARLSGWREPSPRLVGRDITALTARYAAPRPPVPAAALEELLTSPFRQLGLLAADPSATGQDRAPGEHLILHRHRGNTAPRAILACACLEYAHTAATQQHGSITLGRLLTDPAGPGRLLLADRAALRAALTWAAEEPLAGRIALTESAAADDLLTFTAPPLPLAGHLLAHRYHRPDGPGDPR